MILYISHLDDGKLLIQSRAESTDGSIVGDLNTVIGDGGSFAGYTKDQLESLGEGEHDIQDKENSL
jgi:hypothetical protein